MAAQRHQQHFIERLGRVLYGQNKIDGIHFLQTKLFSQCRRLVMLITEIWLWKDMANKKTDIDGKCYYYVSIYWNTQTDFSQWGYIWISGFLNFELWVASVVTYVLIRKSENQTKVPESTKRGHVTFVKNHASALAKIRSRRIVDEKGCFLSFETYWVLLVFWYFVVNLHLYW